MYDTILDATDGSDAANRAVDHASDLASSFDADLHVIYIVDTTRYGQAVLTEASGVLEELEEHGVKILEDVAALSTPTSRPKYEADAPTKRSPLTPRLSELISSSSAIAVSVWAPV